MDTRVSGPKVREKSDRARRCLSLSNDADRDIPLPLVTSGCENSGNLRELALNRMKDFGAECRDVRFREVGVRSVFNLFSLTFKSDPRAAC